MALSLKSSGAEGKYQHGYLTGEGALPIQTPSGHKESHKELPVPESKYSLPAPTPIPESLNICKGQPCKPKKELDSLKEVHIYLLYQEYLRTAPNPLGQWTTKWA